MRLCCFEPGNACRRLIECLRWYCKFIVYKINFTHLISSRVFTPCSAPPCILPLTILMMVITRITELICNKMFLQNNIKYRWPSSIHLFLSQAWDNFQTRLWYNTLLTRTIMIIGPTNVQIAAEVGSGLIQQLNGERMQVWNEPDVTLPAELTPIWTACTFHITITAMWLHNSEGVLSTYILEASCLVHRYVVITWVTSTCEMLLEVGSKKKYWGASCKWEVVYLENKDMVSLMWRVLMYVPQTAC